MQKARRFLSWFNWWTCRNSCKELYQEGGSSGVRQARNGSSMENWMEDFPAFVVVDDEVNDFFKSVGLS